MRRNSHVQFGRIQIGDLNTGSGRSGGCRLPPSPHPGSSTKAPTSLGLDFPPVERGRAGRSHDVRESVSDLHMIRVGVLGETGGLCLLRGEETLLTRSDLKQPPLRMPLIPWHDTILELNR